MCSLSNVLSHHPPFLLPSFSMDEIVKFLIKTIEESRTNRLYLVFDVMSVLS